MNRRIYKSLFRPALNRVSNRSHQSPTRLKRPVNSISLQYFFDLIYVKLISVSFLHFVWDKLFGKKDKRKSNMTAVFKEQGEDVKQWLLRVF